DEDGGVGEAEEERGERERPPYGPERGRKERPSVEKQDRGDERRRGGERRRRRHHPRDRVAGVGPADEVVAGGDERGREDPRGRADCRQPGRQGGRPDERERPADDRDRPGDEPGAQRLPEERDREERREEGRDADENRRPRGADRLDRAHEEHL